MSVCARMPRNLQERFKLDKLFGEVLQHLVREQPRDPIQYIIDFVSYNAEYAQQVRCRQLQLPPCTGCMTGGCCRGASEERANALRVP